MPRSLRLALVAAVSALALGRAPDARAHEVGLSRGDYVAKGDRVDAVIAFARREAISILPAMDADRNESLSDAEVSAESEAYARRIFAGVVVERDGVACTPKPTAARLVSEDGIDAYGTYACAGQTEGATITVKMTMLDTLGSGHRHLVKLSNAGKLDEAMLHRREASLTAKGGDAPAAPAGPAAAPAASAPAGAFRAGLERVFRGRDQLAFVAGLGVVLGLAARRDALRAAGAFVATCSIGLLLAGRDVVAPSPVIVGALAAASVAYVGVESLVVRDRIAAWRVALLFGLVHGLAFGGAFVGATAPGARGLAPLATFHAGVVLGSLALLGALRALAAALAGKALYQRFGAKLASVALIAVGLYGVVAHVRG